MDQPYHNDYHNDKYDEYDESDEYNDKYYYDNYDNNTRGIDSHREIVFDGIIFLLVLSLSQFCFSSIGTCFKNCKKRNLLNKKIKRVKELDLENLINDCSICLEEYKINEKIMILNCNHIYHERCIKMWLDQNDTCPICRENI